MEAGKGDAPSVAEGGEARQQDTVLQYIVIRKDLWTKMGWPLGSFVTQACHAATAAMWLSRESPVTQAYCAPGNLDSMHKVRGAGGGGAAGLSAGRPAWCPPRSAAASGHSLTWITLFPPLQVVLEVKGEAQLRALSEKLAAGGVAHKLWVEQPEGYATCLALAPLPKSEAQPFVKKLKLCSGTHPAPPGEELLDSGTAVAAAPSVKPPE